MKKYKCARDMFQDGIKIRKGVTKAGKEKRKNKREMNDQVSEYFAKKEDPIYAEILGY